MIETQTLFRFLAPDSVTPYFIEGKDAEGKSCTGESIMLDIQEPAFTPLLDCIEVRPHILGYL